MLLTWLMEQWFVIFLLMWHFFIKKLQYRLTSRSIPSCFLHFFNWWRTHVSEAIQRENFLSFSLHYSLSPSFFISQLSPKLQNWASKLFLFVTKLCLAPSFIFYTKINSLLFESYIQFFGLLGIITYNGTPSFVRIFFFFFRWV